MAAPKGNQEEPNPEGRPTKYSEYIAAKICRLLSEGESLNQICKDIPDLSRGTVYNWLSDPERAEFLDKYVQARERQAETFIDQCIDIADDGTRDTVTVEGKDGKEYERVDHDHINRSRLRVDTRIKIAEKLAPRKYTPRKALEHSGKIGMDSITDDQLDNRIKHLEDKFK